MRKVFIAMIVFAVFFIGRYSTNAKDYSTNEEASFEDIDMFSLSGIKKMGINPSYPYVKISPENENKRKISYCINKKMKIDREYKKVSSYWTTSYIEQGDTSKERVFEYILPDKIITLSYLVGNHNQNSYLREVSILRKWNETIYLIQNDWKVKPSIRVSDWVAPHAQVTHKKQIVVKNGILNLLEKTYAENGKLVGNNKTCYEIGSHSYFHWRYLILDKKIIACE